MNGKTSIENVECLGKRAFSKKKNFAPSRYWVPGLGIFCERKKEEKKEKENDVIDAISPENYHN